MRASAFVLIAGALTLAGAFSGCATSPVSTSEPVVQAASGAVASDEGQWVGRFSLRVDRATSVDIQSQQQDNVQGAFSLLSLAHVITLELLSPLGQTMAIVRTAPEGASLRLGDGRQVQAANTQDLLEGQLGWRLPIDRLPLALSALKGEAAAGEKAAQIGRAMGKDWHAQLTDLEEGRTRLQLQWDGLARNVSKLALTLIIEPSTGVSTNLRR